MSSATFDLGTNTTLPVQAFADDGASPPNVVTGLPTVFSVDDVATLTLTDNGDGTAIVVRVSKSAGTATVTASVTNPDGTTVSGTLTVTLGAISGGGGADAVNVTIVPGTPS